MHEERAYKPGDIDKSQWGLKPIAQIASYKGLIFGTFDPDAPSLADYLGEFTYYLDMFLDNEAGGTEFIGGCIRSEMNVNWKLPAENFIGDAYHAGWTHDSGSKSMNEMQPFPDVDLENSYHMNVNGHGLDAGTVHIGDIFSVGSVVLQVSQPRRPCWKVNHKYGNGHISALLMSEGISGWYYRVLEEGEITLGDRIELRDRLPQSVPVRQIWQLFLERLQQKVESGSA